MKKVLLGLLCLLFFASCDDEPSNESGPKLRFKFKFDETQARLDNLGNPSVVASGNASQTPTFNSMSGYYIELVPTKFTQLEDGAIVYTAPTQNAQASTTDFDDAVIFDNAIVAGENEVFLEIPMSQIALGTYEYLRISVTYQNADILFNLQNLQDPLPDSLVDQTGTIAGFIGFNTYISSHEVKTKSMQVNTDKQQGFWLFEPQLDANYQSFYLSANPSGLESGQSPANGTTVVNPLAQFGVTLPQGTCIVTGDLDSPLTITGDETEDITLTLSFSVNQSFEWEDNNGNNKWDIDVGNKTSEKVVDMGLRGLKVLVE